MKTSISDRIRYAGQVVRGIIDPADLISLRGEIDVKVVRADGTIERKTLRNIVTSAGLNRIAARAVTGTGNTPFYNIAVGTQTAAHSLGSVQAGLGEVKRKPFVAPGASAQSREWIFGVATFAGAADTITSLVLESCGISDHVNSSTSVGILANLTNGLGVTLADSDFLNLTMRIRVGSHDVSHTT